MLKTTYKTRNARRRVDELRRKAVKSMQFAENYGRTGPIHELSIPAVATLDEFAKAYLQGSSLSNFCELIKGLAATPPDTNREPYKPYEHRTCVFFSESN